ncbi:MAG: DUF4330 domain-containing protein [Bacillota bacterium]
MRILDERGRLWGKINLLDLLVVLIIIAGLGSYAAMTRNTGKGETLDSIQPVRVELVMEYVKPEVAQALQQGDTVTIIGAGVLGRAESVKVLPAKVTTTRSDGSRVVVEDPENKDMDVTVQANGVVKGKTVKVSGFDLLIGDQIKIRTQNFRGNATVIGVTAAAE